jgi:tetratricopeptide (TPR) repeat protein
MSTQLKSLALTGFALFLMAIPSFAQMTAVEGSIKGPDGAPLNVKGAKVHFDRTDIKGSYDVSIDKKGHFGHYGLPMGTYDLSVIVDGKTADSVKGVKTAYSGAQTVNFDLKPKDGGGTGGLPADAEKNMSKADKEAFEKKNKEREAQLAKNKDLNDAYSAGKAALEAKQYDAAIEAFTKASALDATQVVVWSGLADAYVAAAGQKPADAAGLYDKGFEAYKKAIELKPDDAAYYNNYAIALAKDKKLDDAKTNLDMAAKLDPPGAGKYFYNMGALLVNGGQNDAAGEEFKKAIAADPNYADAQYQYGVVLASKATTDPTGKIVAQPGTTEALQKYIDLKGAACATATTTSAPAGCELVGAAKELIAGLGGTVSTTFQNPNAPAANSNNNKKKK